MPPVKLRVFPAHRVTNTKMFINSECDVFVDGKHVASGWQPSTDSEKECDTLQGKLMGHFRNWPRSRQGGQFSETTDACWMPNACITADGQVLGLLTTELSSKGDAFMHREDGPEREEVEQAIDKLIRGLPRVQGVPVSKREFEQGYFEIDLTFQPQYLVAAVQFAKDIAGRIVNDDVLKDAREFIG